jgi:hypothetical protein
MNFISKILFLGLAISSSNQILASATKETSQEPNPGASFIAARSYINRMQEAILFEETIADKRKIRTKEEQATASNASSI